jgi:uncharacterized membrane protein
MRPLVLVGIILVVLGVAGLFYGGFTYTEDRDTVDLGIAKVEVEDKERVSIHPAVGGVVLAAGIVVLAMSVRKPAAT